jgi:hypothetical protein
MSEERFRDWCRRRCPPGKGCLARRLHDKGRITMPGLDGHLNWNALQFRCGLKKEFEEKSKN